MTQKTKTNSAQGATPATNPRHEVKCCFCGHTIPRPAQHAGTGVFYPGTNNPWPYFEADETRRCCDMCKLWIVMPARLNRVTPAAAARQADWIKQYLDLTAAPLANLEAWEARKREAWEARKREASKKTGCKH